MALADHTAIECVTKRKHRFDFVLDHPSHGDPRPIGHHRRHRLFIHSGKNQWIVPLKIIEFALVLFKQPKQLFTLFVG